MVAVCLGSYTIPKLEGTPDVEVDLNWELAMKILFHMNVFTAVEEITLASSALHDGALDCWETIVRTIVAKGSPLL